MAARLQCDVVGTRDASDGRNDAENDSLAGKLVYKNTILGTRYIETRGYHAYAQKPKQTDGWK